MTDKMLIAIGGIRDGCMLRDLGASKVLVPEGEYQRHDLLCPDGTFSFYVWSGISLRRALTMLAESHFKLRREKFFGSCPVITEPHYCSGAEPSGTKCEDMR